MSLVLYYSPGACSGITINAIEELGLKCEYRKVDLASGEQKTDSYLSINPNGKVPALITEYGLLTENPAILMYLHSLVPDSTLLPTVDNQYQESIQYSDLMWFSSTIHPAVRHVCMPSFFTVSSDVTEVVEKARSALTVYFTSIEKRLATSMWWYGEEWSIADIYIHWCYTRALRGGYSLDAFPVLLEHQKRVETRPSFNQRKEIESK